MTPELASDAVFHLVHKVNPKISLTDTGLKVIGTFHFLALLHTHGTTSIKNYRAVLSYVFNNSNRLPDIIFTLLLQPLG